MKNFTYLFLLSIIVFGLNACKKKDVQILMLPIIMQRRKKMMAHVCTLQAITLIGASDTTISVATEW